MKLEAVGLRGRLNLCLLNFPVGWRGVQRWHVRIALGGSIMFDEPFVGQDPTTMGVLVKLISELNSALGVTCVVVSHDVPEVLSIAGSRSDPGGQKIVAHGSAVRCRRILIRAYVSFWTG